MLRLCLDWCCLSFICPQHLMNGKLISRSQIWESGIFHFPPMQFFSHSDLTGANGRPATSSGSVPSSRPGSGERERRPGTSSGQRRLTSSASSSNIGPSLSNANTNSEILHREMGNDDLLRILNKDEVQLQNDLFVLAEQGNYEQLKKLIDTHRVDLSSLRGLHGYSLLHHAAARGHGLIVAELIRSQRAGVDLRNDLLETPLHLAAYGGHLLIVDQLLDCGADIDAVNGDDESALFYAARRRQLPVIRLLLLRGGDADLADKLGERAVDQAPDAHTQRAFTEHHLLSTPQEVQRLRPTASAAPAVNHIHHDELRRICSYLAMSELLRAACVSRKWHMVSGHQDLWRALGVRRWELALQGSLGFAPTATVSLSFGRPKRTASGRSLKASTSSSGKEEAVNVSAQPTAAGGGASAAAALSIATNSNRSSAPPPPRTKSPYDSTLNMTSNSNS